MRAHANDISAALGITAAFFLIGIAIVAGGSLGAFFDFPSFLIVVGGTCAVTLASFGINDCLRMPSILLKSTFYQAHEPGDVARTMLSIAETAKRKGLLSLQNE